MKRFLALLLTVVILLSTLTCFTFAATISILVNPTVFVGGEIYNIVWVTNEAGIGYVEYTYDGMLHRIYDEENGLVRTDDTIHTVQVPKEHLDAAGSYTVYSTLVTDQTGYSVTTGNTVSVTRSFQGYHGQSEINAWTVTDPHALNINTIAAATANLPCQDPDIVFMLGDLITFAFYKQVSSNSATANYWNHSLCYIFRLAEALTSGTRPVVYARGNHETRAAYSTYLTEYIGGDTGELYFDFTYGPISSIVLDYGEDKVDTHHEYTGFAHFEEYHQKQSAWLSGIDGFPEADTATYKLAVSHGNTIKSHFGHDWMSPLTEYGADLLISGHTHRYTLYTPSDYTLAANTVDDTLSSLVYGTETDDGTTSTATMVQYSQGTNSHVTNFPHLINGCHYVDADGNAHFIASQLTFKDGQITTAASTDVQAIGTSFTINAGLNEENIVEGPMKEQTPATYKKPDYYNWNDDDIIGSTATPNDATFANITKPVVFDTGDNYTVVWASSEGKAATGEVRVHVDGTVYKFADTTSGYSNFATNTLENVGYTVNTFTSTKNIHSAVVPKKYLEEGKYECISHHIMSPAYTSNMELGYEITTGLLDFDGYDDGEDVEMLVVSNWSKSDNMVSKLRSIVKTADVVVMAGDVANKMQTSSDYASLIYDLGALTNGKKPVYFVRGASEINGAFAPYIMKTLKSDTGEFYAKVEFGPVSSVILDTAAHYDDSYAGYGGLVQFENLRAKQLEWLEGQSYGDSEYNLVFSSMPALFDNMGTDYNKQLNTMGTDLAVFSSSDTSAFTANGELAQGYATATNGSYSGDGTVATKLTFADGTITVTAIKADGSALMTNTVSNTANDTATYSDVAETAWYADAVSYASTQTLMVGTSATTFAPEEKVTRGQAAVVLAKLANADLEDADISNTPFTDVDGDAYYAKAVAWCYENKVTYGTSATTFSPEDNITREQICTLICNLYKDLYPAEKDCDFTDFDEVSDYARGAVAALAKAGVIAGMGDGSFAPKAEVTRAQLAQILFKAKL